MDKYTEQVTQSPIENKREQVSKKVWNIENTKLKHIETDGNGKIDYRMIMSMGNKTNFVVTDNKENKRFMATKINDRIYNLATGLEI